MSRLYAGSHRALQDAFGTRRMADLNEESDLKNEIPERERVFIETRDMFFLSTVDERGRPTVSYKGGDPGFIKVPDPKTLIFPSYDGNGMFLSMGNIARSAEVGLLFIDFEKPRRLRLQGSAEISAEPDLLANWADADLAVRVRVTDLWINCPRYVHRYEKVKASRYVPRTGEQTPLAEWKRIEELQDGLRDHERREVEKRGTITEAEWLARIDAGSDEA